MHQYNRSFANSFPVEDDAIHRHVLLQSHFVTTKPGAIIYCTYLTRYDDTTGTGRNSGIQYNQA
jgi:hypothetical protein